MNFLTKIKTDNKFDYNALLSNPKVIKEDFDKTESTINVFIPVSNRLHHLRVCIAYLKHAIAQNTTNNKIKCSVCYYILILKSNVARVCKSIERAD